MRYLDASGRESCSCEAIAKRRKETFLKITHRFGDNGDQFSAMSSPAKNQPHTPTLNSLLRQPSAITTPGSSNAVIGSSGPNASQPPGPSATANAIGGNVPGPGYGAPYSPGPGPVVGADPSIQQQQPPPSQPPQMQSDAYYNHRIGLKGSAAVSEFWCIVGWGCSLVGSKTGVLIWNQNSIESCRSFLTVTHIVGGRFRDLCVFTFFRVYIYY